jgi:hypothetical protein
MQDDVDSWICRIIHWRAAPEASLPSSRGARSGHGPRAAFFAGWLTVCLFLVSTSPLHSQKVALNEIMASNGTALADEDGDFEDWIELHNYGDSPVHLDGFGLSDQARNPFRWVFPDVTLDAGGFLVVWASGKDRRNPNQPLHANFAISTSGESLFLTGPDGVRRDEFPPTPMVRNQSMGRVPDGVGDWFYFEIPTPRAPNVTTPYSGVLTPPALSLPSGFYSEAQEVFASHERKGDVIIRYTLDGSEPGPDSPTLPDPLVIGPRVGDSNFFSAIKTTAGSDFWRAPGYDVPKATVLRVRAFSLRDEMPSRTITRSYFVGPHLQDRYNLPVISLVTDSDHLFDPQTGIYVAGAGYDGNWQNSNYWKRGRDWERPIHLEIFEADGKLGLAQDAGVRIHGGWSRRWAFKSLRLYARSDYGQDTFAYRLFPDQPDENYRRFILRNSGNDYQLTLFRDAFMQRLIGHLRLDTQAYRPAVLFINGEYWGIQNLRERYDRHYLQRTYGVDPDNIDLLTNHRQVKEGTSTHYDELRRFILQQPMASPASLAFIETQMDIDNFIDYQLAQIYLNNTDWPGNNIDFWRLRTDQFLPDAPYGHDGRWRWMVFDTDYGFWQYTEPRDRPTHNTLAFATAAGGSNWPNPDWSTFLLRSLLQNEGFRTRFINRFSDQLNTAFLPHRAVAMINEMAAVIEPEIANHVRRFGRPDSVQTWRNAVQRMRDFAHQRPDLQFEHLRSHFGLPGTYPLAVDLSDTDHGTVRVNSILLKESTPGVQNPVYPWTGRYFYDVPVEVEAIPNPGYQFAHWIIQDQEPHESAKLTLLPDASATAGQHFTMVAVFHPTPPDRVTYWDWIKQWEFSKAELEDPHMSAPRADPDSDGIQNLLEYALSGNPRVPHSVVIPHLKMVGPGVEMSWPMDRSKADLVWRLEASGDLQDWSEILYDSREQWIEPPAHNMEGLEIQTFHFTPEHDQRFFRLQVFLLEQ